MTDSPTQNKTIVLALTGASGMPYARRLLEVLLESGISVHLVYSKSAQIVAQQEIQWHLDDDVSVAQKDIFGNGHLPSARLRVFEQNDWFAPMASGSNPPDAMIICPASMGTIAAIAHGLSENLIERAADVCLKEKRPIVVVPREMPLSTLHLNNLLTLSNWGVHILPPAPGFYHHPKTIADLVDFVVARILDHLGIPHQLFKPWAEDKINPPNL